MKRTFTILVTAVIALSLVSCGARNSNNSEESVDEVVDAVEDAEVEAPVDDVDDSGNPVEIASVVVYSKADPSSKAVWEFSYDEEYRLVGASHIFAGESDKLITTVEYEGDVVTVCDGFGRVTVYARNEDGVLVGESTMEGGNDATYSYSFNRGQLQSLEIENPDSPASITYTWDGGLITRSDASYDSADLVEEYKYSDVVVTTKVNVIDLVNSDDLTAVSLFPGCAAVRYPSEITRTVKVEGEDDEVENVKYVYHTNDSGLVTSIDYTAYSEPRVIEITYFE